MRGIARSMLVGMVAMAAGSLPAAAQTVTFSTFPFQWTGGGTLDNRCTGSLQEGSQGIAGCVFAGYTLTFTPVGSTTAFSGSLVDLGTFTVACVTCVPGALASPPPNFIAFNIHVTDPAGSACCDEIDGAVFGQLRYDPTFSSLAFGLIHSPTVTGGVPGYAGPAVTFQLAVDSHGVGSSVFNIAAPAPGANPVTTHIKAFVTVAPEPSTIALVATGMLGLIPVIRRRRKGLASRGLLS